ncbi:MAG: tol-pal system protein YbgF [Myxococcales bacterium]|nr:tol-pal system protein YbgF [Myxococcales bacterium]
MRRALCLIVCAGGCGPATLGAEVRDLRVRLEGAERARAELQHKVDELDNRLFLLTDQVDSQKVALSRRGGAPSLPVITLRPEPVADEQPRESSETAQDDRPAAPLSATRRPLLQLEGRPSQESRPLLAEARSPARPTQAQPLVADTAGNLGIVKLPDRGVPKNPPHGTASGAPDAIPSEAAPEGEPLALYRASYARLMAGRNEEAAADFRAFVRRYPRHDYADNAQYWLGEALYARKDYASAAPEFQSVVARWPSGNKAPDALLKLGYCLLSLGEVAKGRAVLSQVAEHYPRTEAAQLAERRLLELPRTEGSK